MASQQGNIRRFVEAVNNGQYVEGVKFASGNETETPWWNQGAGPTDTEQPQPQPQP